MIPLVVQADNIRSLQQKAIVTRMNSLPTHHDKFDFRLNILMAVTGLLMFAVFIFGIFALPTIFHSSDNTDAIKRGSDLQACRTLDNSAITDANTTLGEARTDLEVAQTSGLQAVASHDNNALAAAVADADKAKKEVQDATAALRSATDIYRVQVMLSQSDPTKYLADCKGTPP